MGTAKAAASVGPCTVCPAQTVGPGASRRRAEKQRRVRARSETRAGRAQGAGEARGQDPEDVPGPYTTGEGGESHATFTVTGSRG